MVDFRRGAEKRPEATPEAQNAEAAKSGWKKTVEDMRAMAADREDKGFETLTIPAGHTAPKHPKSDDSDEWGIVHVVPGDKAEEFERFYAGGTFDEMGVYQSADRGQVFIVTEHIDMDAELVVFVAGVYKMQFASPLVRTAIDRDEMHIILKKLDGTRLGTFDHDDADAFFPDPEPFYAYE